MAEKIANQFTGVDMHSLIADSLIAACEAETMLAATTARFIEDVGLEKPTDAKGSIACNEKNTRSSDNSAKYHVELRAKDYGTPEGLSRMLDILATAGTPRAITTTMNEQKEVEDTDKPKEPSTPEEKKAGKA